MKNNLPTYAAVGILLLAIYACIRYTQPPLPPATLSASFAPQTQADSKAVNQVAAVAPPSPTTASHLPEAPPLILSERETDALLRAGSAAYLRGNHAAAFNAFRQLADAGNVLGQYNLGVYYRKGIGVYDRDGRDVVQDYDAARRWFEAAAAQGYDDALNNLGELYDQGLGVAQDSNRARQYFEQAVERGNAYAMYNLGVLYENGRGIAQDSERAIHWFEEAVASKNRDILTLLTTWQGKEIQQRVIGNVLRKGLAAHTRGDDATAFEIFTQLAEVGNEDACYILGVFYRDGLGRAANTAAAKRWFERAAEYGHYDAMHNLATLYLMGDATTSKIKANKFYNSKIDYWLVNAGLRGNAYAAYNLGILHRELGDADVAAELFNRAAEIAQKTRNISVAKTSMPARLHYMAGDSGCTSWQVEVTETAAGLMQFGLLQTADCAQPYNADSEDKPAQITLNAWLQSGIMLEAQNHDEWAWYQYKKAAEAGHPVAQNNLANFYRAGRGLPQDGALARQWFLRAAEQGYAKAQNNLAVLYQTGVGGEKDEKAAQAWYEKAARQGFALAQGNLGTLYAQKADERMAQLQRDEDTLGHLFSRPDNQLKIAHAQEIADINLNYALARYWLEKAAAQQDGIAAYNLASLHARGLGGIRDHAQARRYYEQAVAQGVREANVALFAVEALASGEKPDEQTIEKLLRIAREEDKAVAAYTIGWHYLSGAGVARDLVKARWWLERAADSGLAEAQYRVGNLDFYSEGFTARGGRERSAVDNVRDKYNAARHWAAAAKQGHRNAAANLAIWCEHQWRWSHRHDTQRDGLNMNTKQGLCAGAP